MKLQPGRSTRNVRASAFVAATRFIWARLPWHQVIVNVPWNKDGTMQHVLLTLVRGTNKSATIDLTNLTTAELIAFREAVLIATEVAEPIVRRLDHEALEKADNGDDADDRIYRGLPTMAVRQGTLREYDEGVLLRRRDLLQGIGARLLPGKLPEFTGRVVAEHFEDTGSTEDASQENGEPA